MAPSRSCVTCLVLSADEGKVTCCALPLMAAVDPKRHRQAVVSEALIQIRSTSRPPTRSARFASLPDLFARPAVCPLGNHPGVAGRRILRHLDLEELLNLEST